MVYFVTPRRDDGVINKNTAAISQNTVNIAKLLIGLFLLITGCASPINTYASWYVGGSILLHPLPYYTIPSNHINLGDARLNHLANGISINGGYKFCWYNYVFATELDIGSFTDADGDVIYKDFKHYVSASYYLALKQKFGYQINPNFMFYGLLGFSQNSIGDRVYNTGDYFNKKQLSFLSGIGLEYYTKRDSRVALFTEWFYFTPTGKTSYSGGPKPPSGYSISAYGAVYQFGMRYYFD